MITSLLSFWLGLMPAPPAYVVHVQLGNVAPGTTLYLTHYRDAWRTLDSAVVDAAGRCELRGELPAPIMASLKIGGQKALYQVPLHPGDELTCTLAYDKKGRARFTAQGSVGVEHWQEFREKINPYIIGVAQLPAEHRGLRQLRALVRRTPDDFLAAYLTKNYLSRQASQQPFVDSMTTVLAARQPALAETQALTQRVRTAALTEKGGEEAPDFTLPTVAGQSFTLSSLRGKYVLVDFWASWCGPCRQENPRLRKLYGQYQSRGLEIVSVSVDSDAGKWQKAVTQDQLPWPQVSDLKGWDSRPAQLYGVLAVPTTVLIDPNGRILSRNLRAEALEKRLAQLLPAR
ncbi:AhpC/TSA family protein [Hymenobacter weizhouensis]|uniref:AhpC/TSA family protein n=1 Tax=Hymenobacter sp. YIM 151500-1 TaxID=2987689 RepID=UPI0022268ACF|nr:AhpC/TSA family protein [Hymenobacter sp. YIM 151500-1]UYZ64018.1 AhpC/TSA family protein [Hymenobacter sp. YIM 151500-1]